MNPVNPEDNQGKHPIPTVPPSTVASPHGIDFGQEPEMWWTPGWEELWKHLGWRWILLIPAAGVLLLIAVAVISRPQRAWIFTLLAYGGLYSAMVLALPFAVAAYAISTAVAARRDPFCIHCGYGLEGLPDHHRCPECGMPYHWATIEEYRRDPKWFIHRWRTRKDFPAMFSSFDAGEVQSPKRRDGT